MYIPWERRHFLWENLVLLCFSLRLFSRCFMVLWVMFSIYTLLLSSHHVYALDMHTSLCHYALLVAWSFALLCGHCSHLHMTVMCLIKLLICFTSCLLDHIFTCYIILVFWLLSLPWGSNTFCASVSGYRYCVPSLSQVLDLGVNKFCHCSQTHV